MFSVTSPARQAFKPGLTIVELLMVMAMSFIVAATAFSIYRVNVSHYLREEAFLQQQQNLRAGLYAITRDLRMAGNGFNVLGPHVKLVQLHAPSRETIVNGVAGVVAAPGWFRHPDTATPGARAVFGVDGGESRPDTLTVFRTELEYAVPLGLVKTISNRRLALEQPRHPDVLTGGDLVALVQGTQVVVLETASEQPTDLGELDYVPGGRFTGPAGPPSGFNATGASVYNVRDVSLVTYWVDEAESRLMAARHDASRPGLDTASSEAVAANIEDLQIFYFFDDETADLTRTSDEPNVSSARLDARAVKSVAVALSSKSAYGDGPRSRRRPALFNRLRGGTLDERRRSALLELVHLRNQP
ncbi:MAG: hypothetical protein LBU12_07095 [Deltaproteobacteria bacterium]|jgi:hypothetical protein|nr:hypothetical protein [Deltaproteobacteria bacterium]